ncbi:two-component system sensor histidine kinase DesK [Arcanobacterium pluranimalium]|uniref:sensor histidine kinase n=1 Tax=Arcanobacterium pluranimalium TaxID=108028 RepID=UPI001957F730|nr:sensor histidine kinase [Arcanobacterium pluranimalium]MBM7824737.1 two-component system sensor histidine kinase DesK [Arcanobacterium pluranimalium]
MHSGRFSNRGERANRVSGAKTQAIDANNIERRGTLAGYVSGLVWLGFLFYPIYAALHRDPLIKYTALGFTGLFILTYIGSLAVAFKNEIFLRGQFMPRVIALIFTAISITAIEFFLLGDIAVTYVVYLVPICIFLLPMPWNFYISGLPVIYTFILAFTRNFEILSIAIGSIGTYIAVTASVFFQVLGNKKTALVTQMATLEERERVARDVHDVLGHSLTAIALKSELARELVERDPQQARAEIDAIYELSRGAIAEVRATVSGLRVRQLVHELDAVRAIVHDAGIEFSLVGSPDEVTPSARILFAWALREAVTNTVRHAKAQHIWVTLREDAISIRDDGVGMGSRSFGNGLSGLRHRVEDAGAKLSVSSPDPGTEVKIEL